WSRRAILPQRADQTFEAVRQRGGDVIRFIGGGRHSAGKKRLQNDADSDGRAAEGHQVEKHPKGPRNNELRSYPCSPRPPSNRFQPSGLVTWLGGAQRAVPLLMKDPSEKGQPGLPHNLYAGAPHSSVKAGKTPIDAVES